MSRQDNIETFFRDGKTVILPIDHGVAIPVPGLENPFQLIEDLNPYVDGYVVNLGLALRTDDLLTGKGICLRTDVYNTRTTGKPSKAFSKTCSQCKRDSGLSRQQSTIHQPSTPL